MPGYLGTILALTALILALPLVHSWEQGVATTYLVLLGLIGAIPASDLAIALVNRTVTSLLGPRALPRLDLSDGVPEHLRTIVVVPTLLTGLDAVKEQVDRLEIHFLANPDGDLRFALLSDWVDAPSESLPGDDELLAAAADGIERLNQRHGPAPGGGERFFLFHRKRVWNESQERWMGWERKRGKLHELNLFLRGGSNTTFIPAGGRYPEEIPGVRYVITLDADTRVPRGAVARLVGTMAHPLNQPKFSVREGRVIDGYSIVQPRITPTLPASRDGSLFQKIFSGPSGMDPYAFAVSDVYQDLFGEGTYTGKGIYDIDAFEEALGSKVQDNTLLSHDLLEGIFARAALASDIELFEEFPSHYGASAARQHRWARGDWQLLPWLFGKGGASRGKSEHFTIPLISRWKMLDNLRRTLSAPALFLTLLLGWLIPGLSPWVWTGFVRFNDIDPAANAFSGGSAPSPSRHVQAESSACRACGPFSGDVPDRAHDHVFGLSGMADGGCDCAHAGSHVRNTKELAGMGDRSAGQTRGGPGNIRNFQTNDRRGISSSGGHSNGHLSDASFSACRAAVCCFVGCRADFRAPDQPATAPHGTRASVIEGSARTASHFSPDVALL